MGSARACLCGAIECRRHGRRPRTRGADPHPYGADHQARVRTLMATTPEVCARCGGGPRPNDPWEGGHVVAVLHGGGPELQREHRSCNRRAGAKLRRDVARV